MRTHAIWLHCLSVKHEALTQCSGECPNEMNILQPVAGQCIGLPHDIKFIHAHPLSNEFPIEYSIYFVGYYRRETGEKILLFDANRIGIVGSLYHVIHIT